MPDVFIGLTIYNGERFLDEAINSLLSQTYGNFTLFISDDASTDGSRLVCEKYAGRDPRVKYYRQPKNMGMFPNFNFVLDKAHGDYFMWAAQDDIREKDYIKTCVSNLEKNKNIGVATSLLAVIDSYGRSMREELELAELSGKPGYLSVARFVLQPEILGKCNIMYSLFRLDAIKKTWEVYPQRPEWGSDYHFSLAAISRFGLIVEPRVLFKKRAGGYSSPDSGKNDDPAAVRKLELKNPKNHMFPFGRFRNYLRGHMEALRGTPYRPLALIILYFRLPRAFFIFLKEKIIGRFGKVINWKIRNNKI